MATAEERLAKMRAERDELNAKIRKLDKQTKAKAEKERVHRFIVAASTLEALLGEEIDHDRAVEIADELRAAQVLKREMGMGRLTSDGAVAIARAAKAQLHAGQASSAERRVADAVAANRAAGAARDPLTGELM